LKKLSFLRLIQIVNMIRIPTAIYCLFCVFTLASNGRKEISKETECAARSCCRKRDEVSGVAMLHGLCETLSVEECGKNDAYCIWDCDTNDHVIGKRGNTERHFRRVSNMDGEYEEPFPLGFEGTPETFEECMSSGRLIERDDCGVEYEDMMDQEMLRQFCVENHQNVQATKGEHGTDTELYFGDDNTDNRTGPDQRRSVLEHDGRQEISPYDRNVSPYRRVLIITFGMADGTRRRCTASMISPYWAITAAHCVYGGGDWYSNWRLWKHVHSCSDANSDNMYTVTKVVAFQQYTQASRNDWDTRFSWDIAFLRLNKPAGNELGWFGFGYDTGFSGHVYFNIISYPSDKPDCRKFFQSCTYSEWDGDHQQITYECDMSGGSAGSPVYRYKSGAGEVIYAIHAYSGCYDTDGILRAGVCNLAPRITKSKFNAICGYVEQDTANHCG